MHNILYNEDTEINKLINNKRYNDEFSEQSFKEWWTRDEENKILSMCIDWNRNNPYNEIFMCEHENDKHKVDGFYIEDDYWVFEDM